MNYIPLNYAQLHTRFCSHTLYLVALRNQNVSLSDNSSQQTEITDTLSNKAISTGATPSLLPNTEVQSLALA